MPPARTVSPARTAALTTLAMIAFAANSVLGRLGLTGGDIGAGSFAAIRLVSGALILLLLTRPSLKALPGNWPSALALFIYAAAFSYAYLALPAGTGALILFAAVQITMISHGLLAGERLTALQWSGFALALAALVWLLSPGLDAPHPVAAAAMGVSGLAWGLYSLRGRGADSPALLTTGNFARASLIAALTLPLALLIQPEPSPGARGIVLAILSGAVTSGLGYVLWYAALRSLRATTASIAQLTVPALAALGGVLFLSEPLTARFALASLLILGGVALATLRPRQL